MKNIHNYNEFKRINETGEWPSDINWEYVKDNPDADDEYSLQIKFMEDILNEIIRSLKEIGFKDVSIKDIRGFDAYQGVRGVINVYGKNYDVWLIQTGINDSPETAQIFIDDFFINNTEDDPGKVDGYEGHVYELVDDIKNKFKSEAQEMLKKGVIGDEK